MPRRITAPPPQERRPLPLQNARVAAAPLIGAAIFAASELAAGLLLGGFLARGRAEFVLFLAFRPWLLVASAALVSGWSRRRRAAFYAGALLLAAACELILLLALGAPAPWEELLRGLTGAAAIALVADFAVQAARHWRPLAGTLLAAAALFAGLALGAARPYDSVVLGPTEPRAQRGPKPPLLVLTALPLAWGEGGAFDPESRPAEAWRLLEREYELRPIDAAEPSALAAAALMLLAQPRLLAPEELVAVDGWVRRGGRVLVLADPELVWARNWPPGHVLRPPEASLLGPLLAHWGLTVSPFGEGRFEDDLISGGRQRRLVLEAIGSIMADGRSCRRSQRFYLARCALGRGEAVVLADADLLADGLWTDISSPRGSERHLRTADNPLIVADLLDGLAGLRRERSDRPVAWLDIPPTPAAAAARARTPLIAPLPILFVLALGLGLLYGRRRLPTDLSTGMSTENKARIGDRHSL
jgi:hypothetical protein